MKKLTGVFFVVIMLTMGCSLNAKVSDEGAAQSYHWYDGNEQRTVYLDATMIADFNPQSDVATKAAQGASLSKGRKVGGAMLWKLDSSTAKSSLNVSKSLVQKGAYSPVFRSSKAGSARALPGGVIVQFASDWDETRIEQWVSDQGQSIESKATFGTNFYILATQSGMVSLETANRLYETGDVLLASPNWWKEVNKR